ncbi:tetratricopeptide repeat protein [Clostridium saccharoperbutylacetonicum]|uniref:tetratricopeptide repeat protein n=1 Tax=Clostridium saccharoperbutylacetonicum TaxID=36745 RepID=UPI0039EA8E7E
MFDNQVIPPNEKVKKIRQILKATQGEIAEGICTKNNISQIENNKQRLTANLAIGITENFNKIAQEKGMYIPLITVKDLMKDEDSQANDIFRNNIISELKEIKAIDLCEKKLHEAEELMKKYDISDNEKLQLYKFAADFYYHKNMYSKSDEMCNKGLKIDFALKNITEETIIYIYKSRNSIETQRYNEALEQLEYAENLNKRIGNNEFFEKIFFGRALIYRKSGKYDEALKYLSTLKYKFKIEDQKMMIKVSMVYANCLYNKNRFEEAKKEYIEIIDIAMKIDEKDYIAMAYRNLAEVYFNEGKYESADIYIKRALTIGFENQYLNEILYFAAKVFQHVNEDVEGYLKNALDFSEKNDKENFDLIEKIIYELVLIYISKNDEAGIMLMIEKTQELNIDYSLVYLELIEYYRYRNEEKSEYLSRVLIDKIKQNKKI